VYNNFEEKINRLTKFLTTSYNDLPGSFEDIIKLEFSAKIPYSLFMLLFFL